MILLIIGLVAAVMTLVILVCLQAGKIGTHEQVQVFNVTQRNLMVAALKFQEDRHRLMCEVRGLQQSRIAALEQACQAMSAYIKANQPGAQPGNTDSADAWKPPGWKPGE